MKIDLSLYNSTQELYDANSKKFKVRWIIFTIFIVIVLALLMAAFIEFSINKQNYISHYIIQISKAYPTLAPSSVRENAEALYVRKFSFSVVMMLLSAGMLVWHTVSLISAMKQKDFTKYSPWLSSIYGFIITFLIINLFFSSGGFFSIESWNINKLLNVIFTIILPIGYFGLYWPCSRIIKLFRTFKVNQELLKFQNNPMNIFSQMFGQNENGFNNMTNNSNSPILNQTVDSKEQKYVDYENQLNTLSDEKLILMAEKLNIFGAKELSREQLITKIILIYRGIDNAKEQSMKEKQAEESKADQKNNDELAKDVKNNLDTTDEDDADFD
ncbi:hypothetical protein [Mycoplasmopsis arginini]|uniref:hypothetical protein n=1 Tax=Mycoplasmopsis arginini TaxID=2094 RepID=UPI000D6075EB|nr:hypothetical protein [Mycoplasmopsis arginini]MDI3348184.1 hypothetical protein [Mycoplasmopsis arginini]MDI3348831.1 hypothetical protein [Mycoplasmopsis arginini]PWC08936.1 hypothetical protein DIE66_01335 [Mycoplasmopsis arginini]